MNNDSNGLTQNVVREEGAREKIGSRTRGAKYFDWTRPREVFFAMPTSFFTKPSEPLEKTLERVLNQSQSFIPHPVRFSKSKPNCLIHPGKSGLQNLYP